MKKNIKNALEWILAIVIVIIWATLELTLSWIVTCFIVKAIMWCFGINYSWKIATGIWLIYCLAKFIFSKK